MITEADRQKLGRALVASRDGAATDQIGEAMRAHEMFVDVSMDLASAWDKLSRRKYEALVVDCSLDHRAFSFLQQVRNCAANRTAVTFAITDDQRDTGLALKHGYAFALERPLSAESISHTLRVAYGLIVRERRRYFRYPVMVPAVLSRKGSSEIYGRTINISEGGLALHTSIALEAGLEASLEFTLPDPKLRIKTDARVCWYNDDGKTGLSFVGMAFDLTSALNQWLALKLEQELPVHKMTAER
ncbi:MAG TPA: PilZ domain-containing protein [Terriglobales bacterium]|nr:PilZ domain-containing protein [Terriglobales bacterium]